MLLSGVRAVVFDAVGTVIHPDPPAPQVYARVGRRFGSQLSEVVIPERFRASFEEEEARDRHEGWRTSEKREVQRWRRIVAQVLDDVTDPEACFQELYRHFSLPEAWRVEPGTVTVAGELARRGLDLGLASNYDSRLRSVWAGLPALRPFRRLVISSEVGWRKPAPEFFAALCQTVGFSPGQILFIGDDPGNDYTGALAFGLQAVLFDPRDTFPGVPRRIQALSSVSLHLMRFDCHDR
jgi:putative hydrolase of the HAD superfamily